MRKKGHGHKYDHFHTKLNRIDCNDKQAFLNLYNQVKETKPETARKHALLSIIALFISFTTDDKQEIKRWEIIRENHGQKEIEIKNKYKPLEIIKEGITNVIRL